MDTLTILDKFKQATKGVHTTYKCETTDTEVYLTYSDSTKTECFLSFWGATSPVDFWQGIVESSPTSCLGCTVHSGTLQKWVSVRNFVRSQIEVNKVVKVTASAYSQGGSIALLCYLWLRLIYPNIELDFTIFGAYKTVYSDPENILSDIIAEHTLRYYSVDNDIPPKWPFWYKNKIKSSTKLGKSSYPFFMFRKVHGDYENVIKKFEKKRGSSYALNIR